MPDVDISEARWLVTAAGIPGTFQTKTGGDVEVEHTKDRDGGQIAPKVFQGLPNVGDITVGRSLQVPRDQQIAKDLRARLANGGRWTTTLTFRTLNEQMVPVGDPEIAEAVLKNVKGAEINANSSQPSRFELTFTIVSLR